MTEPTEDQRERLRELEGEKRDLMADQRRLVLQALKLLHERVDKLDGRVYELMKLLEELAKSVRTLMKDSIIRGSEVLRDLYERDQEGEEWKRGRTENDDD